MKKILIGLFIILACWHWYTSEQKMILGPGIKAPNIPIQKGINTPVNEQMGQYRIKPLATFNVVAKVLAKKNYSSDRGADLSPTDVTLGWGRMSDESVLKHVNISQSGRFYFWNVKTFPIPRREIETHSANMHLIPANDKVERAIANIKEGEIIEIVGQLVSATSGSDGWTWTSSLTRNDIGNGACELILVEKIYQHR